MSRSHSVKKILILGGGFAGINILRKIQKLFQNNENIKISLVSKDNFFLYTPMLPEVSCGILHPNDITIPIRRLCKQAEFYQADVSLIDLKQKLVTITRVFDGKVHALEYDYLVLALGGDTNFFGNDNIKTHSFVIKTVEDAIAIRTQVINMLENAAQTGDHEFQKKMMTFVVAGGGFAGVETIGELNHFVKESVESFYPSISKDKINMILITAQSGILPEIGERLAGVAFQHLKERGVKVITNTRVVDADESYVELDNGERISSYTLIWTAGTTIEPVIQQLECQHDKSGRILVDNHLRVLKHPNVYALGDCSSLTDPITKKPYPATAQHAIHQSNTVSYNLHAVITGREQKEFIFKSRGLMATMGKKAGVAAVLGFYLKGTLAWLLWRTYHCFQIPNLEKKARVVTSWTIVSMFKRDLTFVGKIKKKTLTRVEVKDEAPSIKDLFRDL